MRTVQAFRGVDAGVLAMVSVVGLLTPTVCEAQFGGGGMGGISIGENDVFTSSNILSPGERDDWPIAVRGGETLILSVSSDVFDPVVELIGPTGQSLGKNDDVRPGEQNALLLLRLPQGGDHKVRVTSSNPTSGGKFTLSVRRFVASDLATGNRTTSHLGKTLTQWHRFSADDGQTIVLSAQAASFQPQLQVYAPNGEPLPVNEPAARQRKGARVVFRATTAGSYYASVAATDRASPRHSYAITVAGGRVFPTVMGRPNRAAHLDAGGVDLWEFRAEAGELIGIQTVASSGEINAQFSSSSSSSSDARNKSRAVGGAVARFVILPSDPKRGGEILALLNEGGAYQVAVSNPYGLATDYSLTTSLPAKRLSDDGVSRGSLKLGSTEYWILEGKAGEIVRFEGSSEQVDTEMELYGPQGDLVFADDDGGDARGALLTALLIDRGRYLLRVHAHGDGASGSYQIRRAPDPVRPLTIGARGEGTVGAGGVEVWSFEGRAGQTVILSARSSDFEPSLAIHGPDASEIASDTDGQADSLLSSALPVGGRYTVWVRTAAGGGRYSLQLFDSK
jgi:hypothetical protein